MQDRISTVLISDYLTDPLNSFGVFSGPFARNGVFLGKKGNNQFSDFFSGTAYPKLDGWVEISQYGHRTYPDYEMPDDLPEWVVHKNYQNNPSSPAKNSPRYIIGEDPLIGPFTFQEIIKIYSVVKKIKVNRAFTSPITASGAGVSLSLQPIFEETEHNQSDITTSNEALDIKLFTPQYKDYVTNSSYSYSGDGFTESITETPEGQLEGASLSVYITPYISEGIGITNPFLPSYTGGSFVKMPIIIDIDNYSEYYIDANAYFNFSINYAFDLTKFIPTTVPAEDEDDEDYTFTDIVGNYTYVNAEYYVGKLKHTEESLEGFTQVSKTATLKIGSLTKEFTMNGYVVKNSSKTNSEYNTAPDMDVGGYLPSSIKFEVVEFWPYKNANGQPVYNTTTGAIINPPIP